MVDGALDDFMSSAREQMRDVGRVPRKLTIIVDLPELPMGNEAGAAVTHHIDFTEVEGDPGRLGDWVRALTKRDLNG